MKKILFFSHYKTTNEIDGANNILMRIANGLPSDQYDKLVVLPDYAELYKELKDKNINTKVFEYDCAVFNGLVYAAQDKNNISKICADIENILMDSELYDFFVKWKPDIVFANTTMGIMAAILGKMVGAKVIWYIHDIAKSFLGKQDRNNLNKIIELYSDKIIVVGKAAKEGLEDVGLLDKCELLYIGVKNHGYSLQEIDTKNIEIRQRLNIDKTSHLIAYLGRISPEKGIDRFIEAANILLYTNSDYRFIIIGNKHRNILHYNELNRLIRKSGRNKEIHFVGHYKDIKNILPAIDCLVIPSCFEDPMPATSVEANLYYKPVVAYDRGGISEAVVHGKNGLLVKQNSITKMANAIYKVLSNKIKAKQMGVFGYYRVLNKFGYNRFMKNIIEIIDEVSQGQFCGKPCRDGDIVCGSNKTLYLIEDNKRRIIQDYHLLEYLGLVKSDVKEIDDYNISQIPVGRCVTHKDVKS